MSWKQYFLFLLPLVVGAVLLALYNYERFGSILELGHRFQLGRTNKYDEYTGLLGILNIPQNFINYLVNPFRRISVFPYIKPTWGKYAIPQLRYSATDFYHTEQVTGALIAAPFLIFAFVPLFRWIRCKWKNLGEERIEAGCYLTERAALQEIYIWLSIAAMFSFSTLLLVGVNSMRHELDFVPLMFLLSVTGYISTYRLLPQSRWVKTLYLSGVWLLVITSAAFALLLAITGYNAAFENLNPDLFDWLVRFLTL